MAIGVGYADRWCGHVVVWDVPGRKLVPMLPRRCLSEVVEVALAGERAAWIRQGGSGNTQYYYVETATLREPRVRRLSGTPETCSVAYCFWSNGPAGDWATNLVGHGDTLAFNAWSSSGEDASGNLIPEKGELVRVMPAGLRRVASGIQTLYAVSTDAGRILVLRNGGGADATLAMYRSDGRSVGIVKTTLSEIRDALIQGRHIAVLTSNAVAVLDAITGRTLPHLAPPEHEERGSRGHRPRHRRSSPDARSTCSGSATAARP